MVALMADWLDKKSADTLAMMLADSLDILKDYM